MEVLDRKEGDFCSLVCDNCEGTTGVLYAVKKEERVSNICTSCTSILGLIADGKGWAVRRIWEAKTGGVFKNKL